MTDVFSAEKRSQIMAAIKSSDTKPEIKMRQALHRAGYRFRKNLRGLPGTPDIVFTRKKVAVQIFGCFWHGHSCRKNKIPKSNVEFWREKLDKNWARDRRDIPRLRALGYLVVVAWECRLKKDFDGELTRITRLLELGVNVEE